MIYLEYVKQILAYRIIYQNIAITVYELLGLISLILFFGKKIILKISCKKNYNKRLKACKTRLCKERKNCIYSKHFRFLKSKDKAVAM